MTGRLILEDGSIFTGNSFGFEKGAAGEVVFSTGMVGYPESFTDPSYQGQILILTYPLIGNYGVPDRKYWESDGLKISGLIVSNYINAPSHFQSQKSLSDWLKSEKIPALEISDTRLLTEKIRNRGTMLGKIIFNKNIAFYNPDKDNLLEKVSVKKVETVGIGNKTILMLDCGAKTNIKRCFLKRNVRLIIAPYNLDPFKENIKFDGLFISNGPGDPKTATQTITTIKKALAKKMPTFGICLGNQLLALAAGGDTKKLKFGHRSQNQPCILQGSKRCFITTQNHGFEVSKIPVGFKPWFTNANDKSNEGIIHEKLPFMSVQFHPEAAAGPIDTEWIFDEFIKAMKHIKKVLILGSGALKIGEAGEFDYSGSQAIKALKEEGIKTVLVNPNIATIQTSKFLADTIYFLPVNKFFVEKIIKKEKPDGILLSFGGQTALNCGLELNKSGVLRKYNVEILGTPISGVELTEDRHKFAEHLRKINIPVPESGTATSLKKASQIAMEIGYPVMIRAGFALGGQGSGIAQNQSELKKIAQNAFSFVEQILIEKYLYHYKEVEYEIVRDKDDNCIAVCNMENMDPLGIHTGESIVIAPSQTLNNYEYHALREAAIRIVRSLNIIGECNVQYALNPRPNGEIEYYVIEVNARLSRSSALASKATGYPLAYVAAKLALGKNLTEIKNKVTQITSACFEPALDYVVVKIPRWDINKFKKADERIGSSMKSVGEVMGIGRRFEEAYQKAIRMLDLEIEGATSEFIYKNDKTLKDYLKTPTPKRMFAISQALREKMTVKRIYKLTGIDPWFLNRIKYIVDEELSIPKSVKKLTKEKLLLLKKIGVSDKRIGELTKTTGLEIRHLRKKLKVIPSVFQIDTLAGEFPAKTNYLYLTYNGQHNDVKPLKNNGVIVLGSGPYRIGSSVEFDWICVNTAINLKRYNKKSIIINCNPETVSTDYDISDRLYFEELTFERIADIYDFENPYGAIISVGGQTPNNRAASLKSYGAKILGTNPENIERAEDRSKFSKLLDDIDVVQPPWDKFVTEEGALNFAEKVGFPVLIRPSFVLSGTLMRVCYTKGELLSFIEEATLVSREYPITISKFIEEAKEIEFDAVALNGEIKASVISDHVENAGVHSGDATIVLPPQRIYMETQRKIEQIAQKMANALKISGPFNIQFLAKDNEVQVIEINLRASRTLPFISKVTGVDFTALCVDAFFGKNSSNLDLKINDFVAVKVAQFSFARLTGADPLLHVEMSSTGEVACFGEDLEEAFLKGEIAVGGKIPEKGIFISLGGDENKIRFLDNAKDLAKLNLPIFATEKTAEFLKRNKIKASVLYKIHEHKPPTLLDYLQKGKIDLAINLVDSHIKKDIDDDYAIRRASVDNNVPLFTNFRKAELFVRAITRIDINDLPIKSWDEYVK